MTDEQIYTTTVAAIVKTQSAMHDLEKLPQQTTYTKEMRREYNRFLLASNHYITFLDMQLSKTTDMLDIDGVILYTDMVTKLDQITKEIKVSVV